MSWLVKSANLRCVFNIMMEIIHLEGVPLSSPIKDQIYVYKLEILKENEICG